MSSAAAATTSLPGEESFLGSFSSFVTSLFPVAHAEEEVRKPASQQAGILRRSSTDPITALL